MIAVFLPDDAEFPPEGVRQLDRYSVARPPRAFAHVAGGATCLVVVYRLLRTVDTEALVALQKRYATKPLLVVAPRSPETVNVLTPFMSDGSVSVVWATELPEALDRALDEALSSDPLASFHDFIAHTVRPEPFVSRVVEIVCASTPPPTSVVGLARRLRVSETTLRYHWALAFPARSLREFIEWAVFVRGVYAAHGGGTKSAPRAAGVHLRTLQRMAGRLVGRPLGEVVGHPETVRKAFERWARAAISQAV